MRYEFQHFSTLSSFYIMCSACTNSIFVLILRNSWSEFVCPSGAAAFARPFVRKLNEGQTASCCDDPINNLSHLELVLYQILSITESDKNSNGRMTHSTGILNNINEAHNIFGLQSRLKTNEHYLN